MKSPASLPVLISAALLTACAASGNPTVPASSVRNTVHLNAHAAYKVSSPQISGERRRSRPTSRTERETTPTISTGNYLYTIAVAPERRDLRGYLRSAQRSQLRRHARIVQARWRPRRSTPTITIKEHGYERARAEHRRRSQRQNLRV